MRVRCRELDPRLGRRQGDAELASLPQFTPYPDTTTMRFGDLPADGQAKATATVRARPGRIDPEEPIEDLGQRVGRDPRPPVGHLEPYLSVVRPYREPNRPVGRGVPQRVFDDVADGQIDPLPVSHDRLALTFDLDADASGLGEGLQVGRDRFRHLSQVYRCSKELELAFVDPGQREQVQDDPAHPIDL